MKFTGFIKGMPQKVVSQNTDIADVFKACKGTKLIS
jgi:hypothetical protein